MKIMDFPESNVVFAKDQPQYRPLPAHRDSEGFVSSCWKLSFWERLVVLVKGEMWLQVMTFNRPPQPLRLSIHKPTLL